MTEFEIEEARQATIRETQEKTNHWLKERGFWKPGQTVAGLMHELAKFRKTSCPKPAGRDWARILKSRIADGKKLPLVCAEMAEEALSKFSAGDEE